MSLIEKNIVDPLKNAYDDLVDCATAVLEAKNRCGGAKTIEVEAALEKFRKSWDLFRCVCDGSQEFIECVKNSLGCDESLVDESGQRVAGRLESVLGTEFLGSQTQSNVVDDKDDGNGNAEG